MTTVAIVQARMNSTRFPGKVIQRVDGISLIRLLLLRLSQSKRIDRILLATPEDSSNVPLWEEASSWGYEIYKGEDHDVLRRYFQAALWSNASTIVRITGDCPLIDPTIVDAAIEYFFTQGVDYVSNAISPTFPDGLDTEVFTFNALQIADINARSEFEREHVTSYIRDSGKFKCLNYSNTNDHSAIRLTVDEPPDLRLIDTIVRHFSPNRMFSFAEVLGLYAIRPELFTVNAEIKRNEGSMIGSGQKLWKRAKQIIPGGNMLLSKRAEMFLPQAWPSYFSKARGCTVWDLDGNPYIDMSIMGIGTNILGYGHSDVDAAVIKSVEAGNMSTLNCPEEVYLAERLVELHPWSDMAKFARTGGEANAVAIRIARAASGKDSVAICGYHGWHDWYLATNLAGDDQLASHLLPGLETNGVPRSLKNSIFSFNYNRFDELETIVSSHDIGTIMMEVSRSAPPEDGFLEKVRELSISKGIVLIFDECTSGFRQTFGGLHKAYSVDPDMAMFGKALGNGYAITAVIGRRGVMEAAQSTFISSTFWTERIGPTAGLKTLEVMENISSWEQITKTGQLLKTRWQEIAGHYGIEIEQWGLPALAGFTIKSPAALKYKTLISQEMLKRGYLAANSVYVSIVHTPEIIDSYINHLADVFAMIKSCEEGRDIDSLLEGPICHAGFQRLN